MSSNTKKAIMVVVVAFLAYFAVKIVVGAVAQILGLLIPVAIVGGVLYIGYNLFGRKALGGGRRTLP